MNRNLKIAIVAGILLIIAGIWAVKNTDVIGGPETAATEPPAVTETAGLTESEETEAARDQTEAAAADTEETEPEAPLQDADPSLEWTTFDFDELVSYNKPMILDFGAEDCGPCQVMAPDLEAFHAEQKENATIRFYDVWKKPELTSGYPIQVVPTQLFFLPDGTPYDPGDRMDDSGIRFTLYYDRETDEHGLTAHAGILTKDQLEMILADMESQAQ